MQGMLMVATEVEAKDIVDIMCAWMPADYAMDMMQEVWDEVGCMTENESLRDTVMLLLHYLGKANEEIDYDLP